MNEETKEILKKAADVREIKADIQERYDIEFPNVWTEPIWAGRSMEEIQLIDKRKAVIGEFAEQRECYSVVSDQYKVASHEEGIHFLEQALEKVQEYGEPVIRPTMWKNGGAMKVEVTFPEVLYEVRKGDALNPKVILKNSYDTTQAFSVVFGALQQVCTNGLHAFKVQAALKGKHTQSLDVSSIVKNISTGMEKFSEQVGLWKTWAEKQLKKEEWETLFEALPFSDKQKEKIVELPITGRDTTINAMTLKGTVNKWDAHSAVTQFLTHEVNDSVYREDKAIAVSRIFHIN